jgi:hypothetical protein
LKLPILINTVMRDAASDGIFLCPSVCKTKRYPVKRGSKVATVIAAPLVLPFWEVPEWAAASGLTRFAALWVPINLAKLATAYLIAKLIGFASGHFELFAHMLEAANKLNFEFYGDLFPQSPKIPLRGGAKVRASTWILCTRLIDLQVGKAPFRPARRPVGSDRVDLCSASLRARASATALIRVYAG